ncbi:MAG: hypothetical protein WHS77_05660 [Brevinematales bacterium]
MFSSFSKNVFFVFLGFAFLILTNIVFNIFSARYLGPSLYGVFNSFFYFLLAFSQPNNSLQLSVAKFSSQNEEKSISFSILLLGFVLVGILLVIFPFIFSFYGIKSFIFSIFGALIVFLWFITAGFRGFLQGRFEFFYYGFNIGFEGLIRLVAVVIFFYLFQLKVEGAILSSIVAGIFAFILLLAKVDIKSLELKINFNFVKEVFFAFLFLVPFGIIFQIDLTLAQNLFSKNEIGYLSACSLYGKNLVILSMVFANVVFSYVLKEKNSYFFKGTFLTFLLFLFSYIFFLFFGQYIILFIQGENYLEAAKFLPFYIIFSFSIALMQQFVNFAYAKNNKYVAILLWIFLIILFFAFYFMKISFMNDYLLLITIFIFAFDLLLFIILRKTLLTEWKK